MNALIKFHFGFGSDRHNRLIQDIWNLDLFTLEHDHTYIQWLFPIDTSHKFNSHAPKLTEADKNHFRQQPSLRSNQQKSLSAMLNFFGVGIDGDNFIPSQNLNMKDHIWLKRGGHNHLRISRIIRSIALCSQTILSQKFMNAMLTIAATHGVVSDESKQYWINAAKD